MWITTARIAVSVAARRSRDRQALVECLFELASGGGLQISEAGAPVIDKMRLKEICITSVDKQIADFARVGLLADE